MYAVEHGAPARAMCGGRSRRVSSRELFAFLAGAIVLTKADQGELDPKLFRAWLDQGLTRADDRALFDLPALPSPKRP
jgi:hypothetical protein